MLKSDLRPVQAFARLPAGSVLRTLSSLGSPPGTLWYLLILSREPSDCGRLPARVVPCNRRQAASRREDRRSRLFGRETPAAFMRRDGVCVAHRLESRRPTLESADEIVDPGRWVVVWPPTEPKERSRRAAPELRMRSKTGLAAVTAIALERQARVGALLLK